MKTWKDLENNYIFKDGSILEEKHLAQKHVAYKTYYIAQNGEPKSIITSKDHILQIDLSKVSFLKRLHILKQLKDAKIPIKEDIIIKYTKSIDQKYRDQFELYLHNKPSKGIEVVNLTEPDGKFECYKINCDNDEWTEAFITRIPKETESQIINKKLVWLPVEGIRYLLSKGYKLYCNKCRIISIEYNKSDIRDMFCITTNTHQYQLNDLIHHNSVLIFNIIAHVIQHNNQIAAALHDIKQTEFSMFKNMNGIVAVAHSVPESVECLRLSRKIMYMRNKEMQKLKVNNIGQYKPTQETGRIWITGRELYHEDKLSIKEENSEKQITALELWDLLHNHNEEELKTAFIHFQDTEEWLKVNKNCVDKIYKDSFVKLINVIDEVAELTMKSGIKTSEEKELDEMRDEIMSIIQSITQLGRSSGIFCLVATQKASAQVIPTLIRDNALSLDTELEVFYEQ